MKQSLLVDTSKCIGCRACQLACKRWNQLPAENTVFSGTYENPPALSPVTWTRISFREKETTGGVKWYFGNQRCLHCGDAACVTVCPAGAISHTDSGSVVIDSRKCIGCNYCAANCPFHVVAFDRQTNTAQKCNLCQDRVQNGLSPACVSACPTGALTFGDHKTILASAYDRVDVLRANGNSEANLYGPDELSTGVAYVLEGNPTLYGLPQDPQVPLSAQIWGALFKPLRVVIAILLAFGFWANRVKSNEAQEAKERHERQY